MHGPLGPAAQKKSRPRKARNYYYVCRCSRVKTQHYGLKERVVNARGYTPMSALTSCFSLAALHPAHVHEDFWSAAVPDISSNHDPTWTSSLLITEVSQHKSQDRATCTMYNGSCATLHWTLAMRRRTGPGAQSISKNSRFDSCDSPSARCTCH